MDRIPLPISSCYVYFIEAVGLNRIKIGTTRADPYARLSQLRVGCPVQLELLTAEKGGHESERWLHESWKHLRITGEWFHYGDEIRQYIRLAIKSNTELWETLDRDPELRRFYIQNQGDSL